MKTNHITKEQNLGEMNQTGTVALVDLDSWLSLKNPCECSFSASSPVVSPSFVFILFVFVVQQQMVSLLNHHTSAVSAVTPTKMPDTIRPSDKPDMPSAECNNYANTNWFGSVKYLQTETGTTVVIKKFIPWGLLLRTGVDKCCISSSDLTLLPVASTSSPE